MIFCNFLKKKPITNRVILPWLLPSIRYNLVLFTIKCSPSRIYRIFNVSINIKGKLNFPAFSARDWKSKFLGKDKWPGVFDKQKQEKIRHLWHTIFGNTWLRKTKNHMVHTHTHTKALLLSLKWCKLKMMSMCMQKLPYYHVFSDS